MPESDRKKDATGGEVTSVSVRAAVDAVADVAIVLIDGYGIIASWNLGAERMMGWTAAQVVGKQYGSLYDAEDRDGRKPEMDRTIAMHEGSRRQEWRRPRSDGSCFWAETSLTSIRDSAGMLLGFLDITRDVTDKRLLDNERERAHEQLLVSERMANLELMAAGVAHEINNPLAFVLVNVRYALAELAELSRDPHLSERLAEITDALDNAREGAERIQQTARDLRVFACRDESRAGVVDVRRVLDACVNMALTEIRHRARLIRDYQDAPAVEGSYARVGQVLLNLLLNAAQAIVEGNCDNNEITVRTFVRDGEVVVEVRDTGTGIADEHLERIFDPFFTTKPVDVSAGLGLPICRRILAGLGGRIEVESQLGKGSTFRVTLPAAHRPRSAAPSPVPAEPGPRGRVLVIDDEPMLVQALRRTLEAEHDVVTAQRAHVALEQLARGERFDVVICDVMMPDLTASDFFEQLTMIDPTMAARVVFLTAGAFTPRARAFLDRVDNPRLEKPFDPDELRAFVRKLIA